MVNHLSLSLFSLSLNAFLVATTKTTGSDGAIMTSMNPSAYRFPSGYAIHSIKKSRIERVLYDQYDPSQDPQGYRVSMKFIEIIYRVLCI